MTLETLRTTRLQHLNQIDANRTDISYLFDSISKDLNIETDFNSFLTQISLESDLVLSMEDEILLSTFESKYNFVTTKKPYEEKTGSVVKVNHGFWEMFVYLLSNGNQKYRQRNLELLKAQLQHSGLLPYLMASIQYCIQSLQIEFMQSLTSGIGCSKSLFENQKENGLDPIRRGCISGCIINTALTNKSKVDFIDSFPVNHGYQKGELANVFTDLSESSSIVLIGPPHLQSLRVKVDIFDFGNCPKQFYLAISPDQALQEWEKQLENVRLVLDYVRRRSDNTVILFQGAVLGPMVAAMIEHLNWLNNTRLFDLGRLLDIEAAENNLSSTGSPLPNRSVLPTGLFDIVETNNMCFQEAK